MTKCSYSIEQGNLKDWNYNICQKEKITVKTIK